MQARVSIIRAGRGLRAAVLAGLLALAGCRSPHDAATSANNSAQLPGSGPSDTYRVRADSTSFFRVSPLQAAGPDEQLKKDTEVVMLQQSRSYSRVKTAGGESGYVATEDIRPLTAGEIASVNAAANADNVQAQLEARRQVAARSMGGDGYTIPPEAGNQEKLPEPDAKPTGPKVNTRANATPTPDPLFNH